MGSIIFRVDGNFPPSLRIIETILTKLSELFRIKLKVDYFYCFFAKNVTCIIEFKFSKSKGEFYEKNFKITKNENGFK